MKVGVVGLGAMGSRVAARLLGAGHELTVWNRDASKADALVAAGARHGSRDRDGDGARGPRR